MKSKEKERSEKEEKEKAAKRPRLGPGLGQPTIVQAVNKLTKVDPQGAAQKQFDKLFVELLASNLLPFSLADSPEWHKIVEFLNKTVNIKTSTTYSKQTEKYAAEIMADVKKMISDLCDAGGAVTTDLWTSRAGDSYISGTMHFIDKDFRLHRSCSCSCSCSWSCSCPWSCVCFGSCS